MLRINKYYLLIGVFLIMIPLGNIQAETDWMLVTSETSWMPRDSAGEMVYDGEMWIMGGFAPHRINDVWHSADGINWIEATSAAAWEPRNLPGSIVYDNKMWIMGGFSGTKFYNDVWSSGDGTNWTAATTNAPWANRSAMGTVTYDNKMWVLGGMGGTDGTAHYNDVWWSVDGSNWTQATNAAPWAQRGMLQSIVFDNKMWVIGGGVYDTSQPMNVGPNYADVWYSTDGVEWTQATTNMAAGDRRFHSSVVYDGRMWIVGGFSSEPTPSNKIDVWSSLDGVDWTMEMTPPWPKRHEVSLLVFSDSMYSLGGFGSELYNDVYKSTVPEPSALFFFLISNAVICLRNLARNRCSSY